MFQPPGFSGFGVHELQRGTEPVVGEHPQPARRQFRGQGDVGAQHLKQQQLAELTGPRPRPRGRHRRPLGGEHPRRWVAHLAVYGRTPRGRTALRIVRLSGQILLAAFLPIVLLLVAGIGWLRTDTAMRIAMWVLVAELGLIAFLAARRTQLHWWQQLVAVIALMGVGALVVGVKTLAL